MFNSNWWVLLFCSLNIFVFAHAIHGKKKEVQTILERIDSLEFEKDQSLGTREELQLRISSQNDPAWIEMVLMQELGVVPEGFMKVHFTK